MATPRRTFQVSRDLDSTAASSCSDAMVCRASDSDDCSAAAAASPLDSCCCRLDLRPKPKP